MLTIPSTTGEYYYSVNATYGVIGAKLFNQIQRFASEDKENAMDFALKLQAEKLRKGYRVVIDDPRKIAHVSQVETPIIETHIPSIQNMVVLRNDTL